MAKKRKGGRGGRGGGNSSGSRRRNITGYGTSDSAQSDAPPYVSPRDRRAQRESDIGSTLIHLGIIWLVVGVLVQLGKGYVQKQTAPDAAAAADTTGGVGGIGDGSKLWKPFRADDGSTTTNILKTAQRLAQKAARASMSPSNYGGYAIPAQQLQNMEAYPNPLRITEEMRKLFHPVVVFDKTKSDPYKVMDFTKRQPDDDANADAEGGSDRPAPGSLIPPDQWTRLLKDRKKSKITIPFTVGRYDEDRRNMYSSDLFDASNGSDARTVHVGIDIGGPVGTKVHAFADGVVHSAGHDPEWGDYGHVIVVEHELPTSLSSNPSGDDDESPSGKVYALYGHLDAGSIRGKKPGKRIKKGQVIGKMGDLKDNGGWYDPHVHFQLSTNPPPTHDLPGVVSAADRPKALVEYPDPRLVLGPLY